MSQGLVEGHVRWPFKPDKCASGLLPDIDTQTTSKGASDIPFTFTKHMRGLAVIISEALAAVEKKRLHCAIVALNTCLSSARRSIRLHPGNRFLISHHHGMHIVLLI